MKIICDKYQFLEMIRICDKVSSCCNCVLNKVCNEQKDLVNMVEIKEDGQVYQVFHGTTNCLP